MDTKEFIKIMERNHKFIKERRKMVDVMEVGKQTAKIIQEKYGKLRK